MPIELNQIVQSAERTVTVAIGGDSLEVRWNPTRMTREMWGQFLAWQAEIRRAERAEREHGTDPGEVSDPFKISDLFVAPLMTGWDITVDGQPYAVTVEHVAGLGLPIVNALMDAIAEDNKAMRSEKKGSVAP